MKIKQLAVTNLRALEHVEFEFDSRINLIVGVNGVGKSTVLDVLRICASRILPSISRSRTKAMSFSVEDIQVESGIPFLEAQMSFEHNAHVFRYTRREWRDKFASDDIDNIEKLRRQIRDSVRLRDRRRSLLRELVDSQEVSDTDSFVPSLAELEKIARGSRIAPNCIFFSTSRSIVSDSVASKSRARGEEAAAYAEALNSRPLYLTHFADWMHAQEGLSAERSLSARHLKVLRSAVGRFLPSYGKLHAEFGRRPRLIIERSGRVSLDVRQLSEGERGVLALVLDLARRLSQANPRLEDPLKNGEAVVLIDEIDLHLHPKWQRQIMDNLTAVFPKCQFIATTHSPQIVAAVEPERVLLLTAAGIVRPDRTLGMDSNWILRHIMEADDRPRSAVKVIQSVEAMIKRGAFRKARTAIGEAKLKGLDFPEWSVFEARMARLEVLAR